MESFSSFSLTLCRYLLELKKEHISQYCKKVTEMAKAINFSVSVTECLCGVCACLCLLLSMYVLTVHRSWKMTLRHMWEKVTWFSQE